MANHLDLLANALKNFVTANYLTTAASVGTDIKAYEDFIYKIDGDIGLYNTRYAAGNATKLGGQAPIDSNYNNFNGHTTTGGGIDNTGCSN